MKLFPSPRVLFFLLLACASCTESATFDREKWLTREDTLFVHPREDMSRSLVEQRVLLGWSEAAVRDSLGTPERNDTVRTLPKRLEDSLRLRVSAETDVAHLNRLYRTRGRADHVMVYTTRQRGVLLSQLKLRFDRANQVDSCWIEHVQL